MANITPYDISKSVKFPNLPGLVQAGMKGTMRNLEYIKVHKGGSHPYALLFGPLGGLLIPDSELVPIKEQAISKPALPQSPDKGPPLPRGAGIKWPWKD